MLLAGLLAFFSAAYAEEVCNQDYCLNYTGGKLLKKNGTAVEDLTRRAGIGVNESVTALAWSGEYWLLGISNYNRSVGRRLGRTYTSTILRYDGKTFTDLSADAKLNKTHIRGVSPKIISIIRCVQEYCLIGYWVSYPGSAGGLLRYDGDDFKELSVEGEIKDMTWNGKEWLIHYRKGEFHTSVVEIYDGVNLKKIIPPTIRFRKEEAYWVTNYTWDATSKSWLIRAKVGVPLSGKPMKEVVVEYPDREVGRGICGPTAAVVPALLPPLLYRRWTTGGRR